MPVRREDERPSLSCLVYCVIYPPYSPFRTLRRAVKVPSRAYCLNLIYVQGEAQSSPVRSASYREQSILERYAVDVHVTLLRSGL